MSKADKCPENTQNKVNQSKKEPVLFLKSGATDLRRGANRLLSDKVTKISSNPLDGNIYTYANKQRTTVKAVQKRPDGIRMTTIHYEKSIEWPKYQPPGTKGHIVTLTGKKKEATLVKLGLSN